MLIGHIEGATRTLGKPADMTDDECKPLAIRDIDGAMVSAWLPTPEELKRLNEGAAIHLWIYGLSHPPVALTVGENEL